MSIEAKDRYIPLAVSTLAVLRKLWSAQSRHWVGRSCRNPHCPNGQKEKTQGWLAKLAGKLLPVQHFVVTFTVPQEQRSLLRAHPEVGYEAIFAAGSETIRTLLEKPKNLGSDKVGFFGVLHTWGRDLKDYHPHVHFVGLLGDRSVTGLESRSVNRRANSEQNPIRDSPTPAFLNREFEHRLDRSDAAARQLQTKTR